MVYCPIHSGILLPRIRSMYSSKRCLSLNIFLQVLANLVSSTLPWTPLPTQALTTNTGYARALAGSTDVTLRSRFHRELFPTQSSSPLRAPWYFVWPSQLWFVLWCSEKYWGHHWSSSFPLLTYLCSVLPSAVQSLTYNQFTKVLSLSVPLSSACILKKAS